MREAKSNTWKKAKANIFWGEIAPCDHVVQIYESDPVFIDALTGFASEGIAAGDSVIIIATAEHLNALKNSLVLTSDIDLDMLITENRFIALDAQETLDTFMVNGWPDSELFTKNISQVITKAKDNNRKVRAFGEMVALLWAQGNNGATVQLEHLWNEFCASEPLSLFCAYPRSGFTQDILESIEHICCTHTKMIAGSERQQQEVIYREVVTI